MRVRKKSLLAAHILSDARTNPSMVRRLFLDIRKVAALRSTLADFSCVAVLAFAGAATISWIAFLVWGLGKLTSFW